ncbi:non-hydrolyzing UDP-N-acetylglucosamine 2-epimerase [Extibacter muris]|uniref:non-hydrolyzing UDP-N-acetylglucosamine 2-epimerase n=1 Tax=Extibacter muris TaxID=1796622 RepID=UPI001D05C980|nr:UDP-N-acetylglucosamine 2-epimerase (non-hydrolyzing) [Extibacter muris]MCB6203678.1 UDP-N-acetylglucosamine 2-epimerase (non-hydrolyzing) [Extibacter muris]MCQ4665232.1 UDP-N-acetylglucosamine 2-epimerase (non-hydrolyzing) [Extibacter muris]MCQ4694646.1 UDP-N-acetylglucosamine 2-epimerase (non-hydrolyzing) [Extibacter muris]
MKIVTVIGARPQFVKAAAVSRVLRKSHEEILVHTGQHYDKNMSDIFFEELRIPRPDINLGVGSGTHAKQTAEMMVGLENVLLEEKPEYLMVYGDTNSTLAGALAAGKLNIPIVHVEAGLRSYNMRMPEEQNRVLTDRISSLLLCPTDTAVDNLKKEGILEGVFNIGDVMCDAVLYYSKLLDNMPREYYFSHLVGLFQPIPLLDSWYMATIHRAENTSSLETVKEILKAFNGLDAPVIFPVHPRTKEIIKILTKDENYHNVLFVEPVSYLDMLFFVREAKKVVTDSGGLQKEAYILQTPCVTVREQTEWIETLKGNQNVLATPQVEDIIDKVLNTVADNGKRELYYGNGDAAKKLCDIIGNNIK